MNKVVKDTTGEPQSVPYVVTLVHGTWGRKSAFIDPNGPLHTIFNERLPGVVFSNFLWSGRNRMADRLRAAADLGRHLRELHEEYPHARLVIVAHSHGGNVALYSLKDPEVNAIVSGVACFATPFISVSKRTAIREAVYEVVLPVALSSPLVALLMSGLLYWLNR